MTALRGNSRRNVIIAGLALVAGAVPLLQVATREHLAPQLSDEGTSSEQSEGLPGSPQPSADPTQSAEVTVTPSSTPDPVNVAAQTGVLRLQGDWERYFAAITPNEALSLLAVTNTSAASSETFSYLLPFDPRRSARLVLEDTTFVVGSKRIRALGANGIAVGTLLYAAANGRASLAFDRDDMFFSLVGDGFINGFAIPREGVETFIQSRGVRDTVPVSLGQKVAVIASLRPTAYSKDFGLGDYQAVFTLGRGVAGADSGSVRQLARRGSKLAFIPQEN